MLVENSPGAAAQSETYGPQGKTNVNRKAIRPGGAYCHGNCLQALTRNKVAANGEEKGFGGEEKGVKSRDWGMGVKSRD